LNGTKNTNWTTTAQEYPYGDNELEKISYWQIMEMEMQNALKSSTQNGSTRASVPFENLNPEQQRANKLFTTALTTDGPVGKLQIIRGKAGTGKSFTLDSLVTSLSEMEGYSGDDILIVATTGKAACNIGGSTVHSYSDGLCLPAGTMKWQELKGKTLKKFQERLKKRKLFVLTNSQCYALQSCGACIVDCVKPDHNLLTYRLQDLPLCYLVIPGNCPLCNQFHYGEHQSLRRRDMAARSTSSLTLLLSLWK
jgi:PIF1 helicase.